MSSSEPLKATIRINGMKIGEAENMFREYRFPLKPHLTGQSGSAAGLPLREGENEIEIEFASAVDYCQKQAASAPYPVPSVSLLFQFL